MGVRRRISLFRVVVYVVDGRAVLALQPDGGIKGEISWLELPPYHVVTPAVPADDM